MDDLVLDLQTTDDESSEDEQMNQGHDEDEEVIITEEKFRHNSTESAVGTVSEAACKELLLNEQQKNQESLKAKSFELFNEIQILSSYVKANSARKLEEQLSSANKLIDEKQLERASLINRLNTLDVFIKKENERVLSLKQEIQKIHVTKDDLARLLVEQDDIEKKIASSKKSVSKKKKRRRSSSQNKQASKSSAIEPIELSDDEVEKAEIKNETPLSMHEALRLRLLNMKRKKELELDSVEPAPLKRPKLETQQNDGVHVSKLTEPNSNIISIDSADEEQKDEDDDIKEISGLFPSLKAKERESTNNELNEDMDSDTTSLADMANNTSRNSESENTSNIYGDTIYKIEKVIIKLC